MSNLDEIFELKQFMQVICKFTWEGTLSLCLKQYIIWSDGNVDVNEQVVCWVWFASKHAWHFNGSCVLLIVGKSEVLDTFTHKHIEILTAYCTCHSAMHFSRQWDIFSGPYLCAYVILAAKELFRGGLASPTGVCQFPSCRCAPTLAPPPPPPHPLCLMSCQAPPAVCSCSFGPINRMMPAAPSKVESEPEFDSWHPRPKGLGTLNFL